MITIVRLKREILGITQTELARRADIHPAYLSSIDRGNSVPGKETIYKIAYGLECDPKPIINYYNRQRDELKNHKEKLFNIYRKFNKEKLEKLIGYANFLVDGKGI